METFSLWLRFRGNGGNWWRLFQAVFSLSSSQCFSQDFINDCGFVLVNVAMHLEITCNGIFEVARSNMRFISLDGPHWCCGGEDTGVGAGDLAGGNSFSLF